MLMLNTNSLTISLFILHCTCIVTTRRVKTDLRLRVKKMNRLGRRNNAVNPYDQLTQNNTRDRIRMTAIQQSLELVKVSCFLKMSCMKSNIQFASLF